MLIAVALSVATPGTRAAFAEVMPASPEAHAAMAAAPAASSGAPAALVAVPPPTGLASMLARPALRERGADSPDPATADPASGLIARREKKGAAEAGTPHPPVVLSAERARTLLRCLMVPGWGQATLGRRTSATVFAIAELGVWTSYTAFRIQERLRRDAYQRTARVLAGIELRGRDEEFRRIVGSYISSDEYNQLVVYRDAANQFYDEHGVLKDPEGYRQYVEEHSLGPEDAWAWPSDEALLRYRGQRKDAQRAALRANAALAAAVVDRLLSALHAARLGPAASSRWELETLPDQADPTAFRVGLRTRF